MLLFLFLDQETWYKGDYTDDNTLALTGTIYQDANKNTVFDLTGYTLEIKGFNQRGEGEFTYDADIIAPTSGTWRFKPKIGELNTEFIGDVEIEMTKTGSVISAKGRNGSAALWVTER